MLRVQHGLQWVCIQGLPIPPTHVHAPLKMNCLFLCEDVALFFYRQPQEGHTLEEPDLSQHKYSPRPCLLKTGRVSQHSPCSGDTVPCTGVSVVSSSQVQH